MNQYILLSLVSQSLSNFVRLQSHPTQVTANHDIYQEQGIQIASVSSLSSHSLRITFLKAKLKNQSDLQLR